MMSAELHSSEDLEHQPITSFSKSKNEQNNNKKRFSNEQIQSLESMFETESRPELPLKQHLANELGLHPRQVAIWFQNKRARSKSKVLDQEYITLKLRYNTLSSRFVSLKKENDCLHLQLQKLRDKLKEPQVGQSGKKTPNQQEKGINLPLDCSKYESPRPLCHNASENSKYFGEEIETGDVAGLAPSGSMSSTNYWGCFNTTFESACGTDQPTCSSQWWDL